MWDVIDAIGVAIGLMLIFGPTGEATADYLI